MKGILQKMPRLEGSHVVLCLAFVLKKLKASQPWLAPHRELTVLTLRGEKKVLIHRLLEHVKHDGTCIEKCA